MPRSFYRCVACDFEADSHQEVDDHERLDCGPTVEVKFTVAQRGIKEFLAFSANRVRPDLHPVERRILATLRDAMKKTKDEP